MAKRGPDLIDPRLAKAIEHPIRADILGILWEGPSSATRIERRLEDVSHNLISHHMKVLKELGCIELAETLSKRGAREHIYRAVRPPILGDEEWVALTPKTRQPLIAMALRRISDELAKSLGSGKFNEIPDNHLSHSQLRLDREGWSEVCEVLARALDDVFKARTKSGERIEASGEAPLAVTVAIMQFPTADGDE